MGGLAHEVNPPAGLKEPIDWMLLTSLPVRTLEEAMEVIGYYEKRWIIEMCHPDYPSSERLYRWDRAA